MQNTLLYTWSTVLLVIFEILVAKEYNAISCSLMKMYHNYPKSPSSTHLLYPSHFLRIPLGIMTLPLSVTHYLCLFLKSRVYFTLKPSMWIMILKTDKGVKHVNWTWSRESCYLSVCVCARAQASKGAREIWLWWKGWRCTWSSSKKRGTICFSFVPCIPKSLEWERDILIHYDRLSLDGNRHNTSSNGARLDITLNTWGLVCFKLSQDFNNFNVKLSREKIVYVGVKSPCKDSFLNLRIKGFFLLTLPLSWFR